MASGIQCSLIIATYNWHKALKLCLTSVFGQTVLPNEIVIADDGSGIDTKEVIAQMQLMSPVPIIHVWHADTGFKLAQIRNKAFAQSSYDYLIQIDGDLILEPHFIEDHLFLAKNNCFVTGSRVLLSKETTDLLLNSDKQIINFNAIKSKKNFFNKFRNRFLTQLLADKYKQSGKNTYYVKGCNMAFWKKDILKVNGYNEIFVGWGREDSELAIRLINSGVKKRFLKMGGVSYHLYHNEALRDNEQKNTYLMNQCIADKTIWANEGINKYFIR